MNKVLVTSLSALLLLILAVPHRALAEIKCETTTRPCFDARTGSTRACQTTICKNEKGEVTSIDTIVTRAGSDTSGGSRLQERPRKTPN